MLKAAYGSKKRQPFECPSCFYEGSISLNVIPHVWASALRSHIFTGAALGIPSKCTKATVQGKKKRSSIIESVTLKRQDRTVINSPSRCLNMNLFCPLVSATGHVHPWVVWRILTSQQLLNAAPGDSIKCTSTFRPLTLQTVGNMSTMGLHWEGVSPDIYVLDYCEKLFFMFYN